MGKYEKEAGEHTGQIQYYYDQGGTAGYSQAQYHYSKLTELLGKASGSKNDKDDVVVIQKYIESCRPLMDDMRQKEDDHTKNQEEQKS